MQNYSDPGARATRSGAAARANGDGVLQRVNCIVCAGAAAEPLYDGILRCRTCRYVFTDSELSDADLVELYSERFFTGEEYSDYLSDEQVYRRNFRRRLRVLRPFLDPARHRDLFEIGCAYGFFLDEARPHFASVQGMDITDAGVRYAREQLKLDVLRGDFLAHDFGARRFDVVCMWDTIEHLRSPHLFVEKIAAHTESGALLALTTGDIESLNARLRGAHWRLIHPPTHLHYFSGATLTRLLDNHGFDVVYRRYCGFERSVRNVLHNILVLRYGRERLYEFLRPRWFTRLSFYLNLHDVMYVIARRR